MSLTPEQDALLELYDLQPFLERFKGNCPDDSLLDELERPRVDECLRVLGLTDRAGSDPLKWLVDGDGWRVLERMATNLLPRELVTLTDNDRALLALMLSEGVTSPGTRKPAALLMAGIGGGDYKKAFKRLKKGGYALSGTGRGSGWYLTSLGKHEAESMDMQNGTL